MIKRTKQEEKVTSSKDLEAEDGEAALNQERKKTLPTWKHHEGSHRQDFKKGGSLRIQCKQEKRPDRFTLLTKTPREILALEKGKFKAPPPMTTPVEKQNANKFCEFHGEVGHNTSQMPIDKESPPAIVLEDGCLNAKDLTLSLMGRVKEMASLVNLKKALCNEGFDVVKISYLGELWVLLEFKTAKAKDSFRGNVGVGSWFSVIKQAYAEFVPEGRLVWVELDGVLFKFWSGPTFKCIAAKWDELLDVDDYDESNLHSKRICILSKAGVAKNESSHINNARNDKVLGYGRDTYAKE
ncbi:hypothetical protein Tco_0353683 [Tanacetum coccineum]